MAGEDIEFTTFDGVTLTKNDYRSEIIEQYVEANYNNLSKVNDFSVGSEALHLADVIAGFILEHRIMIDSNYRMSMIHTAEGEFLDNFGDMVGVHRYPSSPSVGSVTFTRLDTEDTSSPISIPDGLQVATEDAISFLVDLNGEPTIEIPAGSTSVTVEVICEQEGAYTNVQPHTIKLVMDDNVGNLVSVDNALSCDEGADIESDDDYRNRILLAPFEVPTGSLAWHENVCLNITYIDPEDGIEKAPIHDVVVTKAGVGVDYDVKICYKAVDPSKTIVDPISGDTMQLAYYYLESTFNSKEYCIPGIDISFVEATVTKVLNNEADPDITYYFAVLTKQGYALDDLKAEIVKKINAFNTDANVEIEFNPGSLASIIENEITGISSCRIVAYDDSTSSYTEVVSPITISTDHVYQVDVPDDINDHIVPLMFNLDIEVEEP